VATVPKLIVRIKLGGDAVFGPGKADLLESIDRLGSISAAARKMRMSYRQAWMRSSCRILGIVEQCRPPTLAAVQSSRDSLAGAVGSKSCEISSALGGHL